VARLTPTKDFDKVKPEILEQIRKGNSKPVGHFAFPPPADAYPEMAHYVELRSEFQSSQNYDAWMNYGYYDQPGLLTLYDNLVPELHWPQDKQTVADLMFMFYNLGRTKPFDTSFFSWQQRILASLQADPGASQQAKTELGNALLVLNDYFTATCQELAAVPLMFDPTKFDVVGLSEFETTTSRQERQREIVQAREASYLSAVAPKLGLPPFPLDPDPSHWNQ
jgi:hypothetical protein